MGFKGLEEKFMQGESKKYLFDILEACKLIEQFARGKTLNNYRSDALLRSALERQFQIIGEALQQLSRKFPAVVEHITDYRSIISFRHVLVHGYNRIEDDVVWGIVESRLPRLRAEIEKLLHEPDEA